MAEFRPHAERLTDEDKMIVHLSDAPVAETRDLGRDRLVDLAADGRPVRVRYLRMSGGMDPRGVPKWNEVEVLNAETYLDDPEVQASLNDPIRNAMFDEIIAEIARGEPGSPFREVLAEEARRRSQRSV